MKVLVADDDDALNRTLVRYLERWGYEPLCANNGMEAWRILKQENAPDLVILDWHMPGLSGVEVCRLLRATPQGRDAYVLLLTARSQKEDLIEALEAGADDFLSKPFHPRELQLRLGRGITQRETHAQRRASLPDTPTSGVVLDGKYRLERKIADGGMASVWLGVHLSLGVNLAVKFMNRDLAEEADYASFDREARAAAQLRSESVVRVYDHGMTGEGQPYLVMEFLGGETLHDRVQRSGAMSPEAVAWLVGRVARGLEEAHARGIVHRDVKPDNIVLVEDPDSPHGFAPKLVDFGLASRVDPACRDRRAAGTPCYMSPESLRGTAGLDAATDLWGLAVTAFVAVTGRLPFDAATLVDVFRQVCDDPLPVPSALSPNVPAKFDSWFAKACARDPRDRFPSAAALAAALAEACKGASNRPEPAAAAVFRDLPTRPFG